MKFTTGESVSLLSAAAAAAALSGVDGTAVESWVRGSVPDIKKSKISMMAIMTVRMSELLKLVDEENEVKNKRACDDSKNEHQNKMQQWCDRKDVRFMIDSRLRSGISAAPSMLLFRISLSAVLLAMDWTGMAAALPSLAPILSIPVPSGLHQLDLRVPSIGRVAIEKRDCCLSICTVDLSLLSWKEEGVLKLPVDSGMVSSL